MYKFSIFAPMKTIVKNRKIFFATVAAAAFVIFVSAFFACGRRSSVDEESKQIIDSIDYYLKRYPNIHSARIMLVDSVKRRRDKASNIDERIAAGIDLGRIYLEENVDSALMYWRLAHTEAAAAGCEKQKLKLEMFLYSAMPRIGVSIEALDHFCAIDVDELSPDMQHIYYLCAAELYYNLQRPYPAGEYKSRYTRMTIEALDSLSKYYEPGSPVASYIKAQLHLLHGERNLAAANFIEILPQLVDDNDLYDMSLGHVIEFYKDRPRQREMYIKYLMQRALFGLKHGTVRPDVLAATGKALAESNYKTLGNNLITLAMNTRDVRNYAFTDFDRTDYSQYLTKKSETNRMWSFIISGLLAAAIVVCVIYIRHLKRHTREVEAQMAENEERFLMSSADMVKVSSSVLSMALMSDEQLKEYNLYVNRKLKAGQVKDLFQEVQSGEYVRQLEEKFFVSFDETFLNTFPDFIDQLNRLLVEGKELSLLPGRRLSPELRIAAFLRLGVSDSSKLARVLGLSVNTIYTYRNRLKGRAVDRENFESDVQKIGFGG